MSTAAADISPKLYEAATESLVSENTATSVFEKMVTVAYSHATVGTFQTEVKAIESLIKKEFDISSMPGPWRSAKSVIQSAMKHNIKLVDDNGMYHGKTFLQNKIKEAKDTGKEEVTFEEYVARICNLLSKVPEHLHKKSVQEEVHKFLMVEA